MWCTQVMYKYLELYSSTVWLWVILLWFGPQPVGRQTGNFQTWKVQFSFSGFGTLSASVVDLWPAVFGFGFWTIALCLCMESDLDLWIWDWWFGLFPCNSAPLQGLRFTLQNLTLETAILSPHLCSPSSWSPASEHCSGYCTYYRLHCPPLLCFQIMCIWIPQWAQLLKCCSSSYRVPPLNGAV